MLIIPNLHYSIENFLQFFCSKLQIPYITLKIIPNTISYQNNPLILKIMLWQYMITLLEYYSANHYFNSLLTELYQSVFNDLLKNNLILLVFPEYLFTKSQHNAEIIIPCIPTGQHTKS